jgi:hypothetical protein
MCEIHGGWIAGGRGSSPTSSVLPSQYYYTRDRYSYHVYLTLTSQRGSLNKAHMHEKNWFDSIALPK